jgi:glycopeptide antibiotics resistance protein
MGFVVDFDLSTVLFFSLIWIGIVTFLRLKKKKSLVYLIFFTIFYIYIVKVLDFTQFPIYLTESMRANIGQHVWTNMNLIPFFTITRQAVMTSVLNILVTIPFGFGLPFISNFRMHQVVLAGFLTSVTLELLQLFTALGAGFTFRVVDINDVIFNTTGVAVGYLLFVGFVRGYSHVLNMWGVSQNPILRYILERPQVHVATTSREAYTSNTAHNDPM